jgi:hypothetical protein
VPVAGGHQLGPGRGLLFGGRREFRGARQQGGPGLAGTAQLLEQKAGQRQADGQGRQAGLAGRLLGARVEVGRDLGVGREVGLQLPEDRMVPPALPDLGQDRLEVGEQRRPALVVAGRAARVTARAARRTAYNSSDVSGDRDGSPCSRERTAWKSMSAASARLGVDSGRYGRTGLHAEWAHRWESRADSSKLYRRPHGKGGPAYRGVVNYAEPGNETSVPRWGLGREAFGSVADPVRPRPGSERHTGDRPVQDRPFPFHSWFAWAQILPPARTG